MNGIYVLEYGCDEWQSSDEFSSLSEVYDYLKGKDDSFFTMGAYPADYIFITFNDNIIDVIMDEEIEDYDD